MLIALTGHTCIHTSQPTHCVSSILDFLAALSKYIAGQPVFTHILQPIHLSWSTLHTPGTYSNSSISYSDSFLSAQGHLEITTEGPSRL